MRRHPAFERQAIAFFLVAARTVAALAAYAQIHVEAFRQLFVDQVVFVERHLADREAGVARQATTVAMDFAHAQRLADLLGALVEQNGVGLAVFVLLGPDRKFF